VRAIAFDKTPDANWFVPWHQDRAIAVAARAEVAGFDRWTVKDGAPHVEPPVEFLEGMLTLRIHLDDCGEDNGPLECIGGSHRHGRLAKSDIDRLVAEGPAKLCLCAQGDILAIRPLTVHRSQRARLPAQRRVLHLEYATVYLPHPLAFDLETAGTLTTH
jgi:ectoine hydroxylase-related dioxygenase (phytanoyl-CoA dioxygenase family)